MRGEAEYQVPKWAERIANSPKTKCRVFFLRCTKSLFDGDKEFLHLSEIFFCSCETLRAGASDKNLS